MTSSTQPQQHQLQQPRQQQPQQPRQQQPQQQQPRQQQSSEPVLEHHRLRVYGRARELARLVHRCPIQHAELRSQSQRAAVSVALNIAEGAALYGAAKKRHYRIASGSALEVCAAFELAADIGERVPVLEVTRAVTAITSMLAGLLHRS